MIRSLNHYFTFKELVMFGLFKKKSELEKLQEQYEKQMQIYHKLSTTDRAASDEAYKKADELGKQIDTLRSKS